LDDDQRKSLGIVEKLPMSLESSLQALRQDAYLRNAVNDVLVEEYLATKELEIQVVSKEGKEWYWKWY